MNSYLLIYFTSLYGVMALIKLDNTKEPPQKVWMENTDSALKLSWQPPQVSGKDYLTGYRISFQDLSIKLKPNENVYTVELKRTGFKACSVYDFEIAAMYSDFTYSTANASFNYKPNEVNSIVCSPSENEPSIEISWPRSKDNGPCPNATFLVYAYGTQLLDDGNTEQIPEFTITTGDSFLLEGLYPYAQYKIFVRNRRTFSYSDALECTVRTKETVPSWVTHEKAVCTSKTSISVTWTPPLYPNGKILRYWIKVTRSKDYEASYHEVEGHYTRANIQYLNQGEEYTFVIWPENGAGNGTRSNTITVYCF